MNVMKSAVTIILLLFIIHSLGYIYKSYLNIEQFEAHDLDLKIGKSLETAFKKMSLLDVTKQEAMSCNMKK